jgi:hypothetical protein
MTFVTRAYRRGSTGVPSRPEQLSGRATGCACCCTRTRSASTVANRLRLTVSRRCARPKPQGGSVTVERGQLFGRTSRRQLDSGGRSRTVRERPADLLSQVTGPFSVHVPGEGFEPPKLSRLIYSQLPLATRATWLGFTDPWGASVGRTIHNPWGRSPTGIRTGSLRGLADRCAEVQDSWRTRRLTW